MNQNFEAARSSLSMVLQAPKGRRVAAAPVGVRKSKADAKPQNPLYEKRSKNFGELFACRPTILLLYSREALLQTANSTALLQQHKQALAVLHSSQQQFATATGIGGAPPPKKDLHRLVKWPRYVRIQRQRRVLGQRLKVPPALTRFTKTLDKSTAATLFKLLLKYRPEARKEKKERLLKEAEGREAGQKVRNFTT